MGVLFIKSMNKCFRVVKIADSVEEANEFMFKHKDCAVIDDWEGHHIIAEIEETKIGNSV